MPAIGWNVIGANTDATTLGFDHSGYVTASGFTYTAVSGDVVTSFNVYGDGTGNAEVALYTVTAGLPNALVSSAVVAVGLTAGWYTTAVSIALTAGVEYTVALRYFIDQSWNIRWEPTGTVQQSNGTIASNPFPATWSQTGTDTGRTSYYANIPGAAVTLAGLDSAHTHSTGPLILSIGGSLANLDATHAHTSPDVALVRALHVLSIDPANHAHASPAVDMTGLRYPKTISGRKIRDQLGSVYLLRTFSSWGMASLLTNAEITQALDGLAANGFNGATVWIGGGTEEFGGGWHRYQNAAGQNFWTGTPWQSGLGAAWASVDFLLTAAAQRGITVTCSFCGGWTAGNPGLDWEAASNAQMTAAGQLIATRYLAYDNIVWHIMLDSTHTPATTRGQRIQALFGGINAVEGATRRPVRWMEQGETASTNEQGWYLNGNFNCTVNSWYEYGNNSAEIVEQAYGEAVSTLGPIGDAEPPYDGATHYGPVGSTAMAQNLRERTWSTFLEGGSTINYGNENWWPFGAGALFAGEGIAWQSVPTDVHTIQQSYIWPVIDTYVADTTWVPQGGVPFVAVGAGTGDTKAAFGNSQVAAVAYFPSTRAVTVDTSILVGTGNVRLRWYGPTTGIYQTISGSEPQNSGRVLTYPGAHVDGTSDWVLVVDLASDVPLTVEDSTHTHSTGPVVLTVPGVTLTGLDATHTHTSPDVDLVRALHVISVDPALHAHTSPGVVLVPVAAPSLTISPASHVHAADPVTLTIAVVSITVAPSVHGHLATTINFATGLLPSHSTVISDVTVVRTPTAINVVALPQFGD